ncbi:unnamed protein product [Toxocara canis]|uniref:UPF0587 protein C1orf123 homolog n=1 Tax=Toxocara canis TaxID=6265 RepID=A0A183VCX8_TOXCA|nr:unnamed protein product [Toxocara canis]
MSVGPLNEEWIVGRSFERERLRCHARIPYVNLLQPLISLELKATLLNVTGLQPSDPKNFRWFMKESLEMPGSRGEANLIAKCKLCGRVNSLDIIKDSFQAYTIEGNEQYQPIVKFDCRGVEPTEFDPRGGWRAVGVESGTPFEDIDLSEKEWADYDEKSSVATEITELDARFVLSKK